MIDVGQLVFEAFLDWIPTRIGTSIPVIRRRPNAPPPKGQYLVIDDGTSLGMTGRASHGYRTPTDWQSKVQDWSGVVALWEVNARSAALTQILADLDLQESMQFFSGKGITIYRTGPITPMPSLEDSDWVEQFRVEIAIGVATGQTDEALTYIETANLGTISAQDGAIFN